MIRQLLRMFVCVLRGHTVPRWFLRHSMDSGGYNGFRTDRVHLRVGRCERCGDLACEEYEPGAAFLEKAKKHLGVEEVA